LFRDQTSTATRLVRSLAAGVILALALVHIIPGLTLSLACSRSQPAEAVEEMAGLGGIEYPLGGVCVLFGVALMVFLEHLAHTMHTGHTAAGADGQPSGASQPLAVRAAEDLAMGKGDVGAVVPMPDDSHARASLVDEGHAHACVSHGSASNWATAAPEAEGSLRLRVLAYMFELGCVFHSFIIGLSLGVNQTDASEVRALLIALSFHQWLE
ncbi:Fe(2+) transport protein 2, partial [Tetrabaena socialis]